jgi:hypothetical protein
MTVCGASGGRDAAKLPPGQSPQGPGDGKSPAFPCLFRLAIRTRHQPIPIKLLEHDDIGLTNATMLKILF